MSVKVGILICGHFIEEVARSTRTTVRSTRPCWARASTASPTSLWTVKCRLGRRAGRLAGFRLPPRRLRGPHLDPAARRLSARGLCGRRAGGGHLLRASDFGAGAGRTRREVRRWLVDRADRVRLADGHRETVVAFHQDQITAKPEAAAVIASTDFCAFAGLAYPGPTISFQPHPEFTPAFIGDLLEAYQDRLDPAVVTDASARLSTPLSQGGMIGQIRDVLRGGEAMNVAAAVADAPAGAEAG